MLRAGRHVWSERYDRAVADIFAVQDEITENVVASIESQVYAAENIRSESKATESLDAWGCVVRAMPYVWTWAAQDNQKSVELLKRALEADPHYARASSLLAWAYAARAQLGWSEPSEELEKALTMARQAIEQDWEDPWAHLAAGYVHMVSRRFNSAVQELNEALEQNPNFAFAHMLLGSTYGYAGEPEQGLSHVSLAHRLSPEPAPLFRLCHKISRLTYCVRPAAMKVGPLWIWVEGDTMDSYVGLRQPTRARLRCAWNRSPEPRFVIQYAVC